tara:strand:+ start:761 stop:1798 length:1038 start_codon:yes stop_codon:yes gene_type:complete
MLIKEISIFILILICFFYLLNKRFLKIILKYKLVDKPGKNKIHNSSIPVTGGIIFIIGLFFYILIFGFLIDFKNALNEKILIFSCAAFIVFFIGLYDDILNVSSKKKLLIISIINILLFQNIEFFKLKILIFDNSFFSLRINIISLSIIISILSFLAYHYSLTIMDGINGLFGTYCIVLLCIILFFFKLDLQVKNFLIFLILINGFITILNLKGLLFYGNSGSLTMSSIIPYLALYIYNTRENDIYIFSFISLIIIPTLDMARLFIVRLINRKDPFTKDLNHLHHILLQKYKLTKTLIIYCTLCFVPFIISELVKINEIILIFIQVILFLLIIKTKGEKKLKFDN